MASYNRETNGVTAAGRRAGNWFVTLAASAVVLVVVGLVLGWLTPGEVGPRLVALGVFTVVVAPPVVLVMLAVGFVRREKRLAAYGVGALLVSLVGVLVAL